MSSSINDDSAFSVFKNCNDKSYFPILFSNVIYFDYYRVWQVQALPTWKSSIESKIHRPRCLYISKLLISYLFSSE